MSLHPTVAAVTRRIRERSAETRAAYLQRASTYARREHSMRRLGCANVAHAVAGMPEDDKWRLALQRIKNLGIVTAYNDVLSAHAPLERFPALIKDEARRHGATAQVAGGVPAMCDGVTQGLPGMDLSLFSRDNIAMATAIALSHDTFDAALMLGVCDKIVPGLLIGALHFGHLPTVFVPAGPMPSGLSNSAKAQVRERAAQGLVGRDELLQAEMAAYHAPGTCTFYGTANSNQMLLEAMGLHVPGTAFINPGRPLRDELTREAVRTALGRLGSGAEGGFACPPISQVVDERAIVNAMAALLATGGSTNHLIHWVAVARAAGIHIDWQDFSDLSQVVPLLARVYPNGSADVNQFHRAGGMPFVIATLLDAGLLHADVRTVWGEGLAPYRRMPELDTDGKLVWIDVVASGDEEILRPVSAPFSADGGLRVLDGNLGRAVIKVSSMPADRRIIEAPALVFAAQEEVLAAFDRGELSRDVVVVVRFQGPKANGMPELHKLTPPLCLVEGRVVIVCVFMF